MSRISLGRLALAGACLTMLAGCDTLGNPMDILSGKRTTPDEFQVLARKPLRMPGSLALPEPRLGEASALEPDPRTDAVIALLGGPVVAGGSSGGAGEQALLDAANATAEQTEIRAALRADEENFDSNKPYEAPSIFELFGPSEKKPEDAIDPGAESRRLQVQGIAPAPINPEDLPPEQAEEREGAELFYNTVDGKPDNKLPSATTTPAF